MICIYFNVNIIIKQAYLFNGGESIYQLTCIKKSSSECILPAIVGCSTTSYKPIDVGNIMMSMDGIEVE